MGESSHRASKRQKVGTSPHREITNKPSSSEVPSQAPRQHDLLVPIVTAPVDLPTPTRDEPFVTGAIVGAEDESQDFSIPQDNYNPLSSDSPVFPDRGPSDFDLQIVNAEIPPTLQATADAGTLLASSGSNKTNSSDSMSEFADLLSLEMDEDLTDYSSLVIKPQFENPPANTEPVPTDHSLKEAPDFLGDNPPLSSKVRQPSGLLGADLPKCGENLVPAVPTLPSTSSDLKNQGALVIVETNIAGSIVIEDQHLTGIEDPSSRSRLDLQPQIGREPPLEEEAIPRISPNEGIVACSDMAMDFPDHEIEWPLDAQSEPVCEAGIMIKIHMSYVKTIMQKESPPPIAAVRDALRRTTNSYHWMGLARDPWMHAVETIWGEMRNLHETAAWEANSLKIRELEAEVCTMSDAREGLRSQIEANKDRIDTLMQSGRKKRNDAQTLEETIQSLRQKIASLLNVAESRTKEAEQLQSETDILLQQQSTFEETIAAKKNQIDTLKRKKPLYL